MYLLSCNYQVPAKKTKTNGSSSTKKPAVTAASGGEGGEKEGGEKKDSTRTKEKRSKKDKERSEKEREKRRKEREKESGTGATVDASSLLSTATPGKVMLSSSLFIIVKYFIIVITNFTVIFHEIVFNVFPPTECSLCTCFFPCHSPSPSSATLRQSMHFVHMYIHPLLPPTHTYYCYIF